MYFYNIDAFDLSAKPLTNHNNSHLSNHFHMADILQRHGL